MKTSFLLTLLKSLLGLSLVGIAGFGVYTWQAMDQAPKADPKALVAEYKMLSDSLDHLNFKAQEDTAPEKAKLYLDQQHFLQTRIESMHKQIDEASANSSELSPAARLQNMSADLPLVYWSTGAVALVLVLSISILLLKRKKKPRAKSKKSSSPSIAWDEILQKHPPPTAVPEKPSPNTQEDQSSIVVESWKSLMLEEMAEQEKAPSPTEPEALSDTLSKSSKVPEKPTTPASDSQDETKQEVLKLSRRGFSSAEIARHLKISQDKVEFILRLHNPSQG